MRRTVWQGGQTDTAGSLRCAGENLATGSARGRRRPACRPPCRAVRRTRWPGTSAECDAPTCLARSDLWLGRLGAAGVEVVPVHDRVEAEHVGALSLPAPEGPDREHHDVALTHRFVHDLRAVRQRLAALERA